MARKKKDPKPIDERKVAAKEAKVESIGEDIINVPYDPESDYDDYQETLNSLEVSELTLREEKFINELLICGDAIEAALRANYSPVSASRMSKLLLSSPKIKKELDIRRAKLSRKYEISQQKVLEEMAKIAFSNVQDFYDESGNLKNITDLPRDVAASLSSVKVKNKVTENGDSLENWITEEIKLYDKKGQLDTLAKHLGLFEKDNTIMLQFGLQKIMDLLPDSVKQDVMLALMKRVDQGNLLE